MEIHGPHVEQNHASLKAIVEDDVTRSLEQNIIEVMRRTGLLLQKRQAFKYKWEVEGANELKKMDLFRRVHLSRPRTVLSQLAYNFWVKEYNQHSSYNVQEVIQEGIPGAIVIHTSNSNSGYFIPDHMTGGEREECPCEQEWSMQCGCRHFIAKRISRGEDPFCQQNIHPWHLFSVELPSAKATNATDLSAPITEYFDDGSTNDITSYLSSSQSTQLVSNIADSAVCPIAATQDTLASPSKSRALNMNVDTTTVFQSKKPSNIGYNQLLEEATKLANNASHLSNEHIHVVYSLLVGMNEIVETGDHNPNNHKGKALEVFVKQLASLSETSATATVGGPKRKNVNSYGPPTKHRLGAPKSNVTGNKKGRPKCSFCGGGGGGQYHANSKTCPLKNNYGECIDVKKEGAGVVADDIESIFSGRHGFVDCATLGDFSQRETITVSLPLGTKRIQIRSFMVSGSNRYLLCTCLDAAGLSLKVREGSTLTVYENIFLKSNVLTRNVQKCDFVFYKPFTPADMTLSLITAKSPPETMDHNSDRDVNDNTASAGIGGGDFGTMM